VSARAYGAEYRTTTVCISSYENGVLTGRFYNPYLPEEKPFRSMTQFLLNMEEMLDAMDFPRAYTAVRTFAPPPEQRAAALPLSCRTGEKATFAIRVMFRQNASWQGSVSWVEGRREQSFRSVLELILLMDSVLSGAAAE